MAFTKIHHVGMMVRDLEEARKLFVDAFGLAVDEHRTPLPRGRHVPFDNVNILEVPIGEMVIEVNSPNDTESGSARFLQSRGGVGALHHICLYSTDIKNDVGQLRERGLQQALPPGETEWDGRGAAFFHPRSCYGILLEIWPQDDYYPHPAYRGDGAFTGMGHVGLVARSADEMRKFWGETIGLKEDVSKQRAASDNVRIIEFLIGGSVIEISVPQDEVSGTARYLQQRGGAGAALHHICPFAPDVAKAAAKLRAAGVQQIGEPQPETPGMPVRVAWFHPRSCLGTLVEVWSRGP